MLVGPPGTGKTTLLDEALQEIQDDPASYGLTEPPDGVLEVTPEEAWTTRELLGARRLTMPDTFGSPGFVLDAIRDNRWLFLDEANRADMDKIFGGLLTWLSTSQGDPRPRRARATSAIDIAGVGERDAVLRRRVRAP